VEREERKELIAELLQALDERPVGVGGHLLELMRAEQNLVDALGVIRHTIDLIVRTTGGIG
jgi:mevalonate kinase